MTFHHVIIAMTGYLPPLAQLRSLVAVVAHGRLNLAAAALGLTESAVSHHLSKLERSLGVQLLDRSRSPVVLTDAGGRFHAQAQQALRLLEQAVADAAGTVGGKVVLTLPRTLATHWLIPHYPSLYAHHEELELQLLPTTRQCDLQREQIDLGVRLGTGHWPKLQAEPLVSERICPVTTPAEAAVWRQQGWQSMLAAARLVVNELHPQEWEQWSGATGYPLPAKQRVTRLESFDLVLQAALAGDALIMGRTPMVHTAMAKGDLEAPFPEWVNTGLSYYAIWPDHQALNRYAYAVLEWLRACAAETRIGDRHPSL